MKKTLRTIDTPDEGGGSDTTKKTTKDVSEIMTTDWEKTYEETTRKESSTTPEIAHERGGDLSGGGVVAIHGVTEKEGAHAAILRKRKSVKEHGIRESIAIVVTHKGKKHLSDFETVRGATRDEIDNYAISWDEIKILSVDGTKVTIGKKSHSLLIIETIDMETGSVKREFFCDMAARAKKIEEEKLKKGLEEAESFTDIVAATKKVFERKHGRVDEREISEDIKMFIARSYAPGGDPLLTGVTLYVMKKGEKEPKETYIPSKIYDRPRFSQSGARVKIEELKKVGLETILPVTIEFFIDLDSGGRSAYRKELRTESVEIKIASAPKMTTKDLLATKKEDSVEEKIKKNKALLGVSDVADKIISEKMIIRKMKPVQLSDKHLRDGLTNDPHVTYEKPSMIGCLYDEESKTGVFIIKEQIDARPFDPQFRFELYKAKSGAKEAELITEDHDYVSLGDATISLISLKKGIVEYMTREGIKKHKL